MLPATLAVDVCCGTQRLLSYLARGRAFLHDIVFNSQPSSWHDF